jgi:hypothetical protein
MGAPAIEFAVGTAARPAAKSQRVLLSDHLIHGHPQPAGTDALPNRPYEPCCRRNHDEAARIGKGGKKSAGADQSIANASTESRENEMGTMMGSYDGRQRCNADANASDDANLFISNLLSLRASARPIISY